MLFFLCVDNDERNYLILITITIKLDNNFDSQHKMGFSFSSFSLLCSFISVNKDSNRQRGIVWRRTYAFLLLLFKFLFAFCLHFTISIHRICWFSFLFFPLSYMFTRKKQLALFLSLSLSTFNQHKYIFVLRKQMNRKKRIRSVIINIHTLVKAAFTPHMCIWAHIHSIKINHIGHWRQNTILVIHHGNTVTHLKLIWSAK